MECYICRKNLQQKLAKDKNHEKVRDHCHFTGKYRGGTETIWNLRFMCPTELLYFFHNGLNYYYYFIKEETANKFKDQFKCLAENTEKYKIFSFPIKKETRKADKDCNKNIITTSYKVQVIDSARFMASSLSNPVDNLTEGIRKIKLQRFQLFSLIWQCQWQINKI